MEARHAGGSPRWRLVNITLQITPASTDEWAASLDLALQHLAPEERLQRRANVVGMLERGEIACDSILIAWHAGILTGALVAVPLKGASSLFWPPQVIPGVDAILVADALVRDGLDRMRLAGSKIAHSILPAADLPLAASLLRCNFRHITRLLFLRHKGPLVLQESSPVALSFETYHPRNQRVFHQTLEKTYQGSLDIPELNGRRTIDEVIAGHVGQGKFRPELWCLALLAGRPCGVAMLTDSGDGQGLEMAYLGVVPEARAQGIGRSLVQWALDQAFRAEPAQLMVAVDARNPARQLYEKMGFVPVDEREVLLFFFADLADSADSTSPKLHQTTP